MKVKILKYYAFSSEQLFLQNALMYAVTLFQCTILTVVPGMILEHDITI